MIHWFAHLLGKIIFDRSWYWVDDHGGGWMSDDPLITCKRCGKYVNL